MADFDITIIGGGIGGLVSAALLTRAGAKVALFESQRYPGGCCSSFHRGRFRFETGATVACGFHPGGPMDWLGKELKISWPIACNNCGWEYRDNDLAIVLSADRTPLIETFPESEKFWHQQEQIADKLWLAAEILLAQYGRTRYQQFSHILQKVVPEIVDYTLLRLATGSAEKWLKWHGLHQNSALKKYLDAQLLVSAQTGVTRASGLFSAMALDLPRKNPCQIKGGMLTLANLLIANIREHGGQVYLQEKVTGITQQAKQNWTLQTTRKSVSANHLIVNGSDAMLRPLIGRSENKGWAEQNRAEWGAFVLYLGLDRDPLQERGLRYMQLRGEVEKAFGECDSLFLSSTGGSREDNPADFEAPSLTISTHTRVGPWWQAARAGKDAYLSRKKKYEERMLTLIGRHIGDIESRIKMKFSASPITYHRYTGRYHGLVGGYTQTGRLPQSQNRFGLNNLYYVGDHNLPGQSLAGVTVGAAMTADRIIRRL